VNTSSISTLSTLFQIYSSTNTQIFSTSYLSANFITASSLSSTRGFFMTVQTSTVSSFISFTASLQASSFSGNLNDATTILFQRL
jgi:hypothetical protein